MSRRGTSTGTRSPRIPPGRGIQPGAADLSHCVDGHRDARCGVVAVAHDQDGLPGGLHALQGNPHHIFKGQVRVEYTDGHEEILNAGDAFYIPRGHRPYMLADTELLQLTRKSEHNELVQKFVSAGLFPAE